MNNRDRIRIVVADDHPMFREGVARMLAMHADFAVVGTGSTALEAVQLAALHDPALMLLDVNMPGGGLAAAKTIQKSRPAVKIVMLSMSEDETSIGTALKVGAVGYLLKGISAEGLANAMRLAWEGGKEIRSDEARAMLEAAGTVPTSDGEPSMAHLEGHRALSGLERSWLSRAEQGLETHAIAGALGVEQAMATAIVTAIRINFSPALTVGQPAASVLRSFRRPVTAH